MSLTNPNTPVSQQDLQDFYHKLLPYMGGGSGGGADYTAGDGIDITEDVISVDPMPAEDMDDVIDELPTGGNIAVTGYVPLGTLIPFYGETAPKFFLVCDGSTYNKVDYPELANHLLSLTNNAPYIVDGDDTKFKVPDMRGEFIRMTGTNSHTNQGSGASVGVHQDGTLCAIIQQPSTEDNTIYAKSIPITHETADSEVASTNKRMIVQTGVTTDSGGKLYTSRPTNTSVLFCIAYKDIYSNPMNDYSTTEKVVGTWIDGKPLYQKTVSCGTLPNATSKSIAHGIDNLNEVIKAEGYAMDNTSPSGRMPLPFVDPSAVNKAVLLNTDRTRENIVITAGTDRRAFINSYVTLQYTKTTD